MSQVAVVAHRGKHLGGGLGELRTALVDAGVSDALWYEVARAKAAPKKVRRAVAAGAEIVVVWGGDGTVRRCINELAGSEVALGILPAGTANLLASTLGVPHDLEAALDVALHGARRRLDVGVANDEHFALMAGAGFDARMVGGASDGLKSRLGRLAYFVSGARAMRARRFRARVTVDGRVWFDGAAGCVLIGNVGTLTGGLVVFEESEPDDGRLEVGVATAEGVADWLRVMGRVATRQAKRSPFLRTTGGTRVEVRFDRKVAIVLDGDDRKARRRLRVAIRPGAITVCVPEGGTVCVAEGGGSS